MNNNKVKVLHVFNELKFSGAEIMYVDAAGIFNSLGCDLFALSTGENMGEFSSKFEQAGYKIFHRPLPRIRNQLSRLRFFFWMYNWFRKEEFEVIHIHRNGLFWMTSLCAWLAGKKSVYTFHSVFKETGIGYFYQYFLRASAKNIFKCKFQSISETVYQNELAVFHNNSHKVFNWYSNLRFFEANSTEKLFLRNELNIPNDAFVIVSVGGCSTIKRHTEIIESLSLLIQEIPNIIYLHLGTGLTEQSEQVRAKELGLSNIIRFVGNTTDVRKYLVVSDVYVMTSLFEGISITTIEAMACKIPAVLYNVPGLCDFNLQLETCYLIPERIEFLFETFLSIYQGNKLTNLFIERAYNNVIRNYSMVENVRRIYWLYHS